MARYEYEREHEAKKALKRAEELFLAGNIRGAHRHAISANRLSPSFPGLANALAAYQIHIDAGNNSNSNWRAVLAIRPGDAATEDKITKQYRRLSLIVHPDNNPAAAAAAADGAVKLLRRACEDALSAAAAGDKYSNDDGTRRWRPPPPTTAYVPREALVIYCLFCKSEYGAKIGRVEQVAGMKCARCPEWLSAPWQKKPPAKKEPPAGPGRRQVFSCPAKCPACGEQYTSMVSVGRWCLRCKACSKAAMVNVQGPDQATAT